MNEEKTITLQEYLEKSLELGLEAPDGLESVSRLSAFARELGRRLFGVEEYNAAFNERAKKEIQDAFDFLRSLLEDDDE